jgi:hypothetical protein
VQEGWEGVKEDEELMAGTAKEVEIDEEAVRVS